MFLGWNCINLLLQLYSFFFFQSKPDGKRCSQALISLQCSKSMNFTQTSANWKNLSTGHDSFNVDPSITFKYHITPAVSRNVHETTMQPKTLERQKCQGQVTCAHWCLVHSGTTRTGIKIKKQNDSGLLFVFAEGTPFLWIRKQFSNISVTLSGFQSQGTTKLRHEVLFKSKVN